MDRLTEDVYRSQAAIADYREHCEGCGEPTQERRRVYELAEPAWVCNACHAAIMAQLDAEDDAGEICTCERIDVDLYDARGCAAHGTGRAA